MEDTHLDDVLVNETDTKSYEFDEILHSVGEFGTYQKRIYFLICCGAFSVAFNIMGIVFTAGVPDHNCVIPEFNNTFIGNVSAQQKRTFSIPRTPNDACKLYAQNESLVTYEDIQDPVNNTYNIPMVSCTHGWNYDTSLYSNTITTQWDLVCEKKVWHTTAKTVFMVGLLVGALLFGGFSDRFGRRPAVIISNIGQVVFNIAISFSPNVFFFIAMRFFIGIFNNGGMVASFVLAMELVGPSRRVFAGVVIEYFWVFGVLLLLGLGYLIRDWQMLQLVMVIPMVVQLVFNLIFIPESPRWLFTMQKTQKAYKIVTKIATVNKTLHKLDADMVIKEGKNEKNSVWRLIKSPILLLQTANIGFCWFVNAMGYYGISLNISALDGNFYFNFLLSTLVELAAYIVIQVTLTYTRRLTVALSMIIGGVALICMAPIPPEYAKVILAIALIGKFALSLSYGSVWMYTPELFPTCVRNVGIGIATMFARFGGILAPLVGELGGYMEYKKLPFIVFGVFTAVSGLMTLTLPETRGKMLPETIEDAERFHMKSKKKFKKPKKDTCRNMVEENML